MKNFLKKSLAFVLTLAICLTSFAFAGNTTEVSAATDYKTLYSTGGSFKYAEAGSTISHSVTVDKKGAVYFEVITHAAPQGFTLQIANSSGTTVKTYNVSSSNSGWEQVSNEGYGAWGYINGKTLSSGDYTFKIKFTDSSYYGLAVLREVPEPALSAKSVTITKGFTRTIKVDNGKVSKWTTSNKKVATVSGGKITAKGNGKCTITAVLTTGKKLTCKVTVKNNAYVETKGTLKNVSRGKRAMQVYRAEYDSKGNLVLLVRVINNTSTKYTQIKGLKVSMVNQKGKAIGSYSLSKKNVTVGSYSTKDFRFVIAKSKLKDKKADLRNSEVTKCSATLVYYH